eukprot:Gb_26891 [translate_table: standard]
MKNVLLMLLNMYILSRFPQPYNNAAQDEPVNHMRSRVNRARGIRRPLPIIANSIECTDNPRMLSGLR